MLARAETDALFARAFRASSDAIAITRPEEGTMLYINESFSRLTGYGSNELLGQSTLTLGLYADPNDRQRVRAALAESGSVVGLEIGVRTRSGEVRDV